MVKKKKKQKKEKNHKCSQRTLKSQTKIFYSSSFVANQKKKMQHDWFHLISFNKFPVYLVLMMILNGKETKVFETKKKKENKNN